MKCAQRMEGTGSMSKVEEGGEMEVQVQMGGGRRAEEAALEEHSADEASSNMGLPRRRRSDEGEVIPKVQAAVNRKEKAAVQDWVDGPEDYNEAKIWLPLGSKRWRALVAALRNKGGEYTDTRSAIWQGLAERSKDHLYVLSEDADLKYFGMYCWARGQAMVNKAKEDAGRDPTMAELKDIFKMTKEEFFNGPCNPEVVLGNPICYPRMEGASDMDEE